MPRKKVTKEEVTAPKRLYRSKGDRVIAGVAGGLGEYFEVDPTLIRLIFILITIFGGSGIIIYLALWLIMPLKSKNGIGRGDLEKNINEIRDKARVTASEIRVSSRRQDSRVWWGILILVAGFLFLFNNFGFFTIFDFTRIWPLILVVTGLAILLKN